MTNILTRGGKVSNTNAARVFTIKDDVNSDVGRSVKLSKAPPKPVIDSQKQSASHNC